MAEPLTPTILVDVHEKRSGIATHLEQLGVRVEVHALPAGDYVVGEDTLVERKRVLDLHAAIVKGHFWAQIGKLRAASPFPYLLIEGTDIDRGPLHPNAIRGVCLAVIDLGIPLLRSDHQGDSALWLHRLAVRCQRTEPAPDRPLYAQRSKPRDPREAAEAMLASVPGISMKTARALLATLGSLEEVLGAAEEDLLRVPGVGPERARALLETLMHRPTPSA